MKKKLAATLSVVLILGLAVLGILAYLTSEDSDVNVMTLGNVEVKLHEMQRNENKTDLEEFRNGQNLYPAVYVNGNDETFNMSLNKNYIDKIVYASNEGESDAYMRIVVAVPTWAATDGAPATNNLHSNIATATTNEKLTAWMTANEINVAGSAYTLESPDTVVTIDGQEYFMLVFTFDEPIKAGEYTRPTLLGVYLDDSIDYNADTEKYIGVDGTEFEVPDGKLYIPVKVQAIQAAGFDTSADAFAAADFPVNPWDEAVMVDTADELVAAIADGNSAYLAEDITVDANTAITVAAGKDFVLDLNGFTIKGTADKTGNQEMFLVKGNMTVRDGNIEMAAKNNQGWNSMATIFDVTAGGVLNLEGVTANVSGTDMNFVAHLNNWGEATLYANDCDFTTTYVAVRAFNSGYDMNNVTIKDTDFHGGRAFWVHNYTAEGKDDSTLNLDIYNNNNTTDNEKPVRFGFDDSKYYDLNGKEIK